MIDYEDWGDRPVPRIDPDSEPYWSAARDGKLAVQHCRECDNYQFYPRRLCRHCWSTDLEFESVAGTGTVYATTVCHIPGQSGYDDDPPYTLALVDVDLPGGVENDSPMRMMTHIVDRPDEGVGIGTAVEVVFKPIGDDQSVYLPVFRPVE